MLSDYTDFASLETLPLNTKTNIIGKVKSTEQKYLSRDRHVREILLVDTDMKQVKVTVFGNIPKMDIVGLREGRVLEVKNGVIKESLGARYICVAYTFTGCRINVLRNEDQRARFILSGIGKKRKVRGNISRPTNVKTIQYLKKNGCVGQFLIENIIVTRAFPYTYEACVKCKTKKVEETCKNPKCKFKSKKKKEILRIKVTIEDSSARGEDGVEAVMFDNTGTQIMGVSADVFLRKTEEEQRSFCLSKYSGNQFSSVQILIRDETSWVIQDIQK